MAPWYGLCNQIWVNQGGRGRGRADFIAIDRKKQNKSFDANSIAHPNLVVEVPTVPRHLEKVALDSTSFQLFLYFLSLFFLVFISFFLSFCTSFFLSCVSTSHFVGKLGKLEN